MQTAARIAFPILIFVVGFTAIYARAAEPKESIVMLIAKDSHGRQVNGAGIVFGYDNTHIFIATARHNTIDPELFPPKPYSDYRVEFHHRGGHEYVAVALDVSDLANDLAVLKVARQAGLNLPSFRNSSRGQSPSSYEDLSVIGIGSPSWRMRNSRDYVLGTNSKNQLLVKSDSMREGYSGGGLFGTDDGELIGMISATDGEEATIIPALFIADWFRKNRLPVNVPGLQRMPVATTSGKDPDRWRKANLVDLGLEISRSSNMNSPGKISYEITAVVGSMATKFLLGDRIEKINYKNIPVTFNWERDVLSVLTKRGAGVTFATKRNGQSFVLRCENRNRKIVCR